MGQGKWGGNVCFDVVLWYCEAVIGLRGEGRGLRRWEGGGETKRDGLGRDGFSLGRAVEGTENAECLECS